MSADPEPVARRTGRIDLAETPPFDLGGLHVVPASREAAAGLVRQVVEPRVLQVLVALAEARGETVSREVLVQRCWEGRAIGDDAIQRAIAKARRLAELSEPPGFEIESIARVGYRLTADGASPAPASTAPPLSSPLRVDRRITLGGAGAIALAGAGGVGWLALRQPRQALPSEAQNLLDQGRQALNDGTPDRSASALALLRRATEAAPNAAEPWGALALGYSWMAGRSEGGEEAQLATRAREAARRALAIDHNTADAVVALATLDPPYRRWFAFDAECRKALTRFPAHGWLNARYASFLANVGRERECIAYYDRAFAALPLQPQLHWARALFLWAAGRLDEADATLNRAFGLWPRHYAVWHTRARLLSYTGRTEAALAQIADVGGRPIGEPDWNFELCRQEALSLRSQAAAEVDATLALFERAMAHGANHAINACQFASVVGRLDKAFIYVDAYFFGRGPKLASAAYSSEQAIYYAKSNRLAWQLFMPSTIKLRADPRFAFLTRTIGLEDYWMRSTPPDYRVFSS